MPILRADPPAGKRGPVTLRAVHASAAVHAWYYAELDRLIDCMHDDVKRAVRATYNEITPPELAHDAPTRNPSLLLRAALRKWGGLWVRRFDKLSLDLSKKFAKKSFGITQTQMRAALKDAGFTVKFSVTPHVSAAYQAVIAEQVNLIKSIPQQYLKDVESKVWNSVMAGADMHELARDLRQTYGITRDRAALIARDQNNKAKAIIENVRREELGITQAIWQHSAGGKVPRATHVAMSGKRYKLSEGMYDSAEGAYILPGQLINCRCTSRAIIPGFERPEQGETEYLRAAAARAESQPARREPSAAVHTPIRPRRASPPPPPVAVNPAPVARALTHTVLSKVDEKRGMELIEVSASEVDKAFARLPDFYVGPGGENGIGKRHEAATKFLQSSTSINASTVGNVVEGPNGPQLQFIDGRHRFAALRDLGAKTIKLAAEPETVARMRALGWERKSVT